MYSDVFCKVYNEFGWNYYPEIFGEQLLQWLRQHQLKPKTSLDLGCGTGILCQLLQSSGIQASGMDFSSGMIDIARQGSPDIHYEVADMITYCPDSQYDLVTCTGDALNHIWKLSDVRQIFQNVYRYTSAGGYFIFDILNEQEVSTSEPFEMDWGDTLRVWFQMTRPETNQVNLKVRVFKRGKLLFEENIHETIHDPMVICDLLRQCGFVVEKCGDCLLESGNSGTTWYVVARKPEGDEFPTTGTSHPV